MNAAEEKKWAGGGGLTCRLPVTSALPVVFAAMAFADALKPSVDGTENVPDDCHNDAYDGHRKKDCLIRKTYSVNVQVFAVNM